VSLENEVKNLMKNGVYDPHVLFKTLYERHPIHYSKIREAIHNAKQY
jgi:hypothetical protein